VRQAFSLCFALLFAGTALAGPRLTAGSSGTLYQFWLEPSGESQALYYSRSGDQGINYSPARLLKQLPAGTTGCDLKIAGENELYLAYGVSGEAWFTSSTDNGRTFGPAQLITSEALGSPAVAVDGAGAVSCLFLRPDRARGLSELCYLAGLSQEPVVIEQSADELGAARLFTSPWGALAVWQKQYRDRAETFLALTLDGGRHFNAPRRINPEKPIELLYYLGGKWRYRAAPPDPLSRELEPAPVVSPQLLAPAAGALVNTPTLEVRYRLPAAEPAIDKIELSWQKTFPADKTWSFERFDLPGTGETSYVVPVDLPDGDYYIRLTAFDGLVSSPATDPLAFRLDRQAPAITLLSPAAATSEARNIVIDGKLNEKARLTLNGQPVTVEAGGRFRLPYQLAPGDNRLSFTATDEAGNTAALAVNCAYSSLKPALTIKKPHAAEWFKPDSAVLFAVTVFDLQDDIEDESEAEIEIEGKILDDRLVYDRAERDLSGFIKLPSGLADGKIAARIRLRDLAGNLAEEEVTINIDRTAPALDLASGEASYSSAASLVRLPFSDAGAGLDPAATLITFPGVSFEAISSAESLYLRPVRALAPGSYEVTVTPRDRIGNSGPAAAFPLVVDDQAPELLITGSSESQGRCRLEARVSDAYPGSVNIYNNGKLADSFRLNGPLFVREIALTSGSNDLRIEALDKAGNSTSSSLSVTASALSGSATVARLGNAPNPFTPASGPMLFTYTLNAPADLKFYIFDLSGTLIWQKTALGAVSGNLAWDGRDHFGGAVVRGVYPYTVQANSGGAVELHRGKIIVY